MTDYRVEYRPATKLWAVVNAATGRTIAVKPTEKQAKMTAAKEGKRTGRTSGWAAPRRRGNDGG